MENYNMMSSNIASIEEAVSEIISVRNAEKPYDLSIGIDGVNVSDNIFHCHDTDYVLLDSAKRSLNDMFRIPPALYEQLSVPVLASVYNDLLAKKPRTSRFTIRCVKDSTGTQYIRVILQNRHGILDDGMLFPYLVKRVPADTKLVVRNLWIARTHSAMRVIMSEPLQKAGSIFGGTVRYGFDLVNSEVIPSLTWIKGIIEVEDAKGVYRHLVVPKILPAINSSDKSDIAEGMKKFFEFTNTGVDASVVESVDINRMREENTRSKMLRGMYEAKHLIRRDVQELYKFMDGSMKEENIEDAFRQDKLAISALDMSIAVADYAATMDSYLKRSQLEFVPNIWFGRVRK